MDFDKLLFTIWRFIKDKRGQWTAIDFAIALSIFLIAFSQVLGMAINSATTVTEQTTRDHIYIAGNSFSDTLLTTTGGFDWDDTDRNNLENANGITLGLHNSSSNSPGFALHPNALARLDSGSLFYLPTIDEAQYGVPDPYYDSSYHLNISPTDFNTQNRSNIPRGERFYFGLHSVVSLNMFTITIGNDVDIIANVTNEGEKISGADIDKIRFYVVAPDGTSNSYIPSLNADGDYEELGAIDLTGIEGRYAIIGMVRTEVGNWDYRVVIYDNNPTNYIIKSNATLLETTAQEANLYSWESGNTSSIATKTCNIVFGENNTILSKTISGNLANLGTISSVEPVIVVVNVVDDDGNRGVNFITLPLLFDGDVRSNQQIRPVYGLDPTESTIYTEYIHNYVSVRGMIFEATICYWRIS